MSKRTLLSNDILLSTGIVAENLRRLRQQKGLTQKGLAIKLSKNGLKDNISPLTISAYETSQRMPGVVLLIVLADIFGVSVDYLLGHDSCVVNTSSTNFQQKGFKIRTNEYEKYNNQPVWVEFPDGTMQSRWGILDFSHRRVVFPDCICQLDNSMNLYSIQKPMVIAMPKRYISYSQMMESQTFGIESYSKDSYIKGQYEGLYKHSPNKDYIVNIGNGLTLPHAGFGISYIAYSLK